jgi:hypothetical protein
LFQATLFLMFFFQFQRWLSSLYTNFFFDNVFIHQLKT